MKTYTALLIALGSNRETFTISRETTTLSKRSIYRMLKKEAHVSADEMDTILVFQNAIPSPHVVKFWRGANGDFEEV